MNITMCMEDALSLQKSFASDLDRHFDDRYVQIFKEVMSEVHGAYRNLEEDFLEHLKIYTGGTRDISSFMELITGAMEEITDGLYRDDDRDFLYDTLRGFEHCGLNIHFRSIWGMLPFGLSTKYVGGSIGEGRKILVLLDKYRDMQYSFLLLKELFSEYKKRIRKLEQELELRRD